MEAVAAQNGHLVKASRLAQAEYYASLYARMPIVDLGRIGPGYGRILAICGGGHIDASFKNLLGVGLLLLAHERGILRSGQTIVESTSGSLGQGLAVACRILDHPAVLVSDRNLPSITRRKIELLGARLVLVEAPHPDLGWQQARENKVRELLNEHVDWYWTDQNNTSLNPEVYTRWLVPELAAALDASCINVNAAVFGVGSGGHFVALARWLKSRNSLVRTYAADRIGSITFGADPGPSRIRGIGNQNIVPRIIADNIGLVDGIEYVEDREAFEFARRLAADGLFVGGSSGLILAAAVRVARKHPEVDVLTLFPDRGELYHDTLWSDEWMRGAHAGRPVQAFRPIG